MGALLTIFVNALTPNKRKARSNRETVFCEKDVILDVITLTVKSITLG